MNVLIRADASLVIGSGHVMRCLTLADQLRSKGMNVAFVCRNVPGKMFELLTARGYQTVAIEGNWSQQFDAEETIHIAGRLFPDGLDWIVVDNYELDIAWESRLRAHTRKFMVIDDLANRHHGCDLLLDQNYYRDLDQRYKGLVPEQCITLLGPSYLLLRPEFVAERQRLRNRDGVVRRIMIFFGGSDSTNQTKKAIEALRLLNRSDIHVDIVIGSANPFRNEIERLCSTTSNLTFHCQVSNMAELISSVDLAIGAGGSSMWERCFLGLPALTVVFAANQEQTTEDVAETGAIKYLGWADKLTPVDYAFAINEMIANPQEVQNISCAAHKLIGENRVSVSDAMFSMTRDN